MKNLTKTMLKILLLVILGGILLSQGIYAKPSGKANVVLEAMKEELTRSMKILGKKGSPPPYFISYQITDNHSAIISTANGALLNSDQERSRLLHVDVRVGSYQLDNTHAMRGDRYSRFFDGFSPPVPISLEDDPHSIKESIWLETDKKYKASVEKLIRVKANKGVTVKEEDQSEDFSKEDSNQYIGEVQSISPEMKTWEAKLKNYSAQFNQHPEIHWGSVNLEAGAENKYFVNSEGTALLHGRNYWRLTVSASAIADDGMRLSKFKSFYARTPGELPDDEKVNVWIHNVITDLLALQKAPVMEPYTGPAIISAEASGILFHEIFGHRMEGHRQKDEKEGQTFTKKINQQVLPTFLSVYDDPTLKTYENEYLNGHYLFDDEGVKAQRADLVKDGILKGFLMSRSPINGFSKSNGHGRCEPGLRPVSRMGVLVVEASQTVSKEKLRQMLITECKAQGKEYGLFFAEVSGGFTNTTRLRPEAFNVTPIMVYKIYVDNRPDELVRGVNLIGTPLTSFGKFIAAGDKPLLGSGTCGAESGGVPVSEISPPLLTTQIEVQKQFKESNKPPVLPPPQRRTK